MESKRILGFGVAALAFLAVETPLCRAQYAKDYHPYVFDAGAGKAWVQGADKGNFSSFWIYHAGAGIALSPGRPDIVGADGQTATRGWNLFLKGEFLYGRADLIDPKSAVESIISSNRQNPVLLSATGGNGKFYSATFGPRVQYSRKWFSVYGQAGFGWLRRTIDLTGVSTAGTVLQPNNPSVYAQSGDSGAFRGALGVAAGGKGVRAFLEAGVLKGFAINHGTTLAPMLSGGVRW